MIAIQSVRAELDRAEAKLIERLNLLRVERDEALAELMAMGADLSATRVSLATAIKERDEALAELAKARYARAEAIAERIVGVAHQLPAKPPVTRKELADWVHRRLTEDSHEPGCKCKDCDSQWAKDRDLLDRIDAELKGT